MNLVMTVTVSYLITVKVTLIPEY